MSTVHLTVGIPGSGKTTWAKAWVAEDPQNRIRINRDDTRAFLNLKHGEDEQFVTAVQHASIHAALINLVDVVVDDTNLVPKFAKELLKIAKECDAEVEWHEEFLNVDVRTCIDRDRNRDASVGQDVILKMAERAKQWKRPTLSEEPDLSHFAPYTGTPGKPEAFLVDLDGTIAHNDGHRGFFDWAKVGQDDPVEVIIRIVRAMERDGLEAVFVSGRDDVCYDDTYEWITRHVYRPTGKFRDFALFMRPRADQGQDSLVKLEIFDRYIRDNYDVKFALDDRNQVVRAYRDVLGLTVLQVRDGDF